MIKVENSKTKVENLKNQVGNSTVQVCDIRSILCLLFLYYCKYSQQVKWQGKVEQGSNQELCKWLALKWYLDPLYHINLIYIFLSVMVHNHWVFNAG